jgi:hypothetical protein
LQETTSNKKSSAVSSSVVLETYRETVTRELRRSSLCKNAISVNKRVCNLADNKSVGETNDKTILGRLVFVLVLGAKTLSLTVVRTSLTTTTEFDLIAAKVCLALLYFGELCVCVRVSMRRRNKERCNGRGNVRDGHDTLDITNKLIEIILKSKRLSSWASTKGKSCEPCHLK